MKNLKMSKISTKNILKKIFKSKSEKKVKGTRVNSIEGDLMIFKGNKSIQNILRSGQI